MVAPLVAVAGKAVAGKGGKAALKKAALNAGKNAAKKKLKKKGFLGAFIKIIFGIVFVLGGSLGTVGSIFLTVIGIGFITGMLGIGLVGTGIILIIWGVIDLFRATSYKMKRQAQNIKQDMQNNAIRNQQQQMQQQEQQAQQQPPENTDSRENNDKKAEGPSSAERNASAGAPVMSGRPK